MDKKAIRERREVLDGLQGTPKASSVWQMEQTVGATAFGRLTGNPFR